MNGLGRGWFYFLSGLVLIGLFGLCSAPSAFAQGSNEASSVKKKWPEVVTDAKTGRLTCSPSIIPSKTQPKIEQTDANQARFINPMGVGEIMVGQPVPASIDKLEGRPYDQAFQKAARTLSHDKAMEAGHFNMAGYPTIRLKKLDLTITLANEKRVLSLTPGQQIRTIEGTGVGSTLAQLKYAHGRVHLSSVPEPHRCAVSVRGLPYVSFMYTTCERACRGEGALKVHVGGANYDVSKQRWRRPYRRPPPASDD
ncbi:MAG: hypothetical protein VYA30_05185 [Myxococcota bacterium]|nr:hypothetical protein [Myxococcota bacterium]